MRSESNIALRGTVITLGGEAVRPIGQTCAPALPPGVLGGLACPEMRSLSLCVVAHGWTPNGDR